MKIRLEIGILSIGQGLFELFVGRKQEGIFGEKTMIFFLEGGQIFDEGNLAIGGLAEKADRQTNRSKNGIKDGVNGFADP